MHLAASLKIPTVGLFGPSDIKQYSPWGDNTLSIRTPESPSELMNNEFFSPKNKASLMKGLKVTKVEKEIINFHNKLNVTKK